MQQLLDRLPLYLKLMRADKPIGTLLLLWPTLWALWLAAGGWPQWHLLIIFTLGVFLMRSAGCVINDYVDRDFDSHVRRTAQRPLAIGRVDKREALLLCAALCALAFVLVLFTNKLTILLSFGAVMLAGLYPFMKRFTHLPQVVLGAAFGWGIPMAFAAQSGTLPRGCWVLFIANILWTVVYDTFYAMVDRDDDVKIGVKSTAILFGDDDRLITGALQVCVVLALIFVGTQFKLGYWYFVSLIGVSGLFIYQQYLIRYRQRDACFRAFLHNNWVGAVVFAGIVMHYLTAN
ncbi:MAG TPA: 4-hydroxybenzoate octaprenyltransferase [Spongiibacteraceae bacterium]|jgi:4-hydroxybenzoate polyprenyltransferase